jgi:hypothetical protein
METAAILLADAKEDIIVGEVTNIPLSDEERLEYNARIARILDGFQQIARASLDMWRDLKYIKDHRLYREKYDTFHDFCAGELGKDNSQVYRYLKDAEIKEDLLLEASTDEERLSIMSLKESNTRFIRKLDQEVMLPFWKVAYGIGVTVLPHKEDGSVEPTTGFLESVANQMDEILDSGGVNLDGAFIPFDKAKTAAESAGTDEETVKQALLTLGVTEEYFEVLERQKDRIREKSIKTDYVPVKGIVETRVDINGSEFPVLIDAKGNEVDLVDLLLSFNQRFINLSIKSPMN